MAKELKSCLVCGFGGLKEYCNLGEQPLANNLKSAQDCPDDTYPMLVNYCPMCTGKQLSIAVDPEILFKDYLYKTGISDVHNRYFDQFAQEINNKLCRGAGMTILDIGCNDGSMLKSFKKYGWDVTGIDPGDNFGEQEIKVIKDFFPSNKLFKYTFDVITAFNVFAHNDNPREFMKEMVKRLNIGGRIYIQNTLARVDSFYHEHITYSTPFSMMYLAREAGLEIRSIKEVSMHGLSQLYELAFPEKQDMHEMDHLKDLEDFVGYGAAAHGIVLMNYLKLKPEYVVDDNELKQGKFIPGVGCPVVRSRILEADPRSLTIVIFAYNLFDEIVDKIKKLRPGKKDIFIDPRKKCIMLS